MEKFSIHNYLKKQYLEESYSKLNENSLSPYEMEEEDDLKKLVKTINDETGLEFDDRVRGSMSDGRKGYYIRMSGRGYHYFENDDILKLQKAFEKVNKITNKFDYEYGSVSDYETDIDDDRSWAASVSFFATPKELQEIKEAFVSKRRAKSELKQKLAGKRDDGMGKSTIDSVIAVDKDGKEKELKKLDDFNSLESGTKYIIKELHQKSADLVDGYELEDLERNLEQLYRDMEQEAEPEGGPISDQYADEIHFHEEAIRFIKNKGKEKAQLTYDQAIGREEITDETGTYTMGKNGVKNYIKINPITRDEFEKSSKFDRLNEDLDDPDEDLVIIGSGYLDIKSKFGERPSQTNGEYAEIGQKVVDQLHNGDKEAALDYIISQINEGSCGYTPDGKPRKKPAGPDLLKLEKLVKEVYKNQLKEKNNKK